MSETLSNAQPARLAPPWDDKKEGFPRNINVVREQRDNQQIEIQEAHWDARSKGKLPVCGQVLNISLFFDGTNNNLESELKASSPNPTNIGRKFKLWISTVFLLGFSHWAYSETLDDLFSLSKDSIYAPATVRVYDLMGENAAIVKVTVNYNSSERFRVTAFGTEACCTLVPKIPVPGKQMDIEWVVDPNPGELFLRNLQSDEAFSAAYKKHEANYITYRKTLPYPDYKEPGDVNVFFMPCNEVYLVIDEQEMSDMRAYYRLDENAIKKWGIKTCPKP